MAIRDEPYSSRTAPPAPPVRRPAPSYAPSQPPRLSWAEQQRRKRLAEQQRQQRIARERQIAEQQRIEAEKKKQAAIRAEQQRQARIRAEQQAKVQQDLAAKKEAERKRQAPQQVAPTSAKAAQIGREPQGVVSEAQRQKQAQAKAEADYQAALKRQRNAQAEGRSARTAYGKDQAVPDYEGHIEEARSQAVADWKTQNARSQPRDASEAQAQIAADTRKRQEWQALNKPKPQQSFDADADRARIAAEQRRKQEWAALNQPAPRFPANADEARQETQFKRDVAWYQQQADAPYVEPRGTQTIRRVGDTLGKVADTTLRAGDTVEARVANAADRALGRTPTRHAQAPNTAMGFADKSVRDRAQARFNRVMEETGDPEQARAAAVDVLGTPEQIAASFATDPLTLASLGTAGLAKGALGAAARAGAGGKVLSGIAGAARVGQQGMEIFERAIDPLEIVADPIVQGAIRGTQRVSRGIGEVLDKGGERAADALAGAVNPNLSNLAGDAPPIPYAFAKDAPGAFRPVPQKNKQKATRQNAKRMMDQIAEGVRDAAFNPDEMAQALENYTWAYNNYQSFPKPTRGGKGAPEPEPMSREEMLADAWNAASDEGKQWLRDVAGYQGPDAAPVPQAAAPEPAGTQPSLLDAPDQDVPDAPQVPVAPRRRLPEGTPATVTFKGEAGWTVIEHNPDTKEAVIRPPWMTTGGEQTVSTESIPELATPAPDRPGVDPMAGANPDDVVKVIPASTEQVAPEVGQRVKVKGSSAVYEVRQVLDGGRYVLRAEGRTAEITRKQNQIVEVLDTDPVPTPEAPAVEAPANIPGPRDMQPRLIDAPDVRLHAVPDAPVVDAAPAQEAQADVSPADKPESEVVPDAPPAPVKTKGKTKEPRMVELLDGTPVEVWSKDRAVESIDWDTVNEFLSAITPLPGMEGKVKLRSLLNGGKPIDSPLYDPTSAEDREAMIGFMRRAAENQRNVYHVINPTSGQTTRADDIKHFRTHYYEVDTNPFYPTKDDLMRALTNVPVPPDMIVDSGKGFHLYWFVEPHQDAALYRATDARIKHMLVSDVDANVKGMGGDKGFSPHAGHVARIPGMPNIKWREGMSQPTMMPTSIAGHYRPEPDLTLTEHDLFAAFPPAPEPPRFEPVSTDGVPEATGRKVAIDYMNGELAQLRVEPHPNKPLYQFGLRMLAAVKRGWVSPQEVIDATDSMLASISPAKLREHKNAVRSALNPSRNYTPDESWLREPAIEAALGSTSAPAKPKLTPPVFEEVVLDDDAPAVNTQQAAPDAEAAPPIPPASEAPAPVRADAPFGEPQPWPANLKPISRWTFLGEFQGTGYFEKPDGMIVMRDMDAPKNSGYRPYTTHDNWPAVVEALQNNEPLPMFEAPQPKPQTPAAAEAAEAPPPAPVAPEPEAAAPDRVSEKLYTDLMKAIQNANVAMIYKPDGLADYLDELRDVLIAGKRGGWTADQFSAATDQFESVIASLPQGIPAKGQVLADIEQHVAPPVQQAPAAQAPDASVPPAPAVPPRTGGARQYPMPAQTPPAAPGQAQAPQPAPTPVAPPQATPQGQQAVPPQAVPPAPPAPTPTPAPQPAARPPQPTPPAQGPAGPAVPPGGTQSPPPGGPAGRINPHTGKPPVFGSPDGPSLLYQQLKDVGVAEERAATIAQAVNGYTVEVEVPDLNAQGVVVGTHTEFRPSLDLQNAVRNVLAADPGDIDGLNAVLAHFDAAVGETPVSAVSGAPARSLAAAEDHLRQARAGLRQSLLDAGVPGNLIDGAIARTIADANDRTLPGLTRAQQVQTQAQSLDLVRSWLGGQDRAKFDQAMRLAGVSHSRLPWGSWKLNQPGSRGGRSGGGGGGNVNRALLLLFGAALAYTGWEVYTTQQREDTGHWTTSIVETLDKAGIPPTGYEHMIINSIYQAYPYNILGIPGLEWYDMKKGKEAIVAYRDYLGGFVAYEDLPQEVRDILEIKDKSGKVIGMRGPQPIALPEGIDQDEAKEAVTKMRMLAEQINELDPKKQAARIARLGRDLQALIDQYPDLAPDVTWNNYGVPVTGVEDVPGIMANVGPADLAATDPHDWRRQPAGTAPAAAPSAAAPLPDLQPLTGGDAAANLDTLPESEALPGDEDGDGVNDDVEMDGYTRTTALFATFSMPTKTDAEKRAQKQAKMREMDELYAFIQQHPDWAALEDNRATWLPNDPSMLKWAEWYREKGRQLEFGSLAAQAPAQQAPAAAPDASVPADAPPVAAAPVEPLPDLVPLEPLPPVEEAAADPESAKATDKIYRDGKGLADAVYDSGFDQGAWEAFYAWALANPERSLYLAEPGAGPEETRAPAYIAALYHYDLEIPPELLSADGTRFEFPPIEEAVQYWYGDSATDGGGASKNLPQVQAHAHGDHAYEAASGDVLTIARAMLPTVAQIRITSEQGPGHPDGIDLAANEGDPIHAWFTGVVEQAGTEAENPVGGNYVIIRDAQGNRHYLGHMRYRPAVRAGQAVGPGTQIGVVGSTGQATGPHVHWEVRDHANAPQSIRQTVGGGSAKNRSQVQANRQGPLPPDPRRGEPGTNAGGNRTQPKPGQQQDDADAFPWLMRNQPQPGGNRGGTNPYAGLPRTAGTGRTPAQPADDDAPPVTAPAKGKNPFAGLPRAGDRRVPAQTAADEPDPLPSNPAVARGAALRNALFTSNFSQASEQALRTWARANPAAARQMEASWLGVENGPSIYEWALEDEPFFPDDPPPIPGGGRQSTRANPSNPAAAQGAAIRNAIFTSGFSEAATDAMRAWALANPDAASQLAATWLDLGENSPSIYEWATVGDIEFPSDPDAAPEIPGGAKPAFAGNRKAAEGLVLVNRIFQTNFDESAFTRLYDWARANPDAAAQIPATWTGMGDAAPSVLDMAEAAAGMGDLPPGIAGDTGASAGGGGGGGGWIDFGGGGGGGGFDAPGPQRLKDGDSRNVGGKWETVRNNQWVPDVREWGDLPQDDRNLVMLAIATGSTSILESIARKFGLTTTQLRAMFDGSTNRNRSWPTAPARFVA